MVEVEINEEDIEEMISTSAADYNEYLKTKKISRLRDATNKLVAAAENLTSAKTGKLVKNYGEFRGKFVNEFKDEDLVADLGSLHTFFYNGLGYEQKPSDIVYLYNRAKKKLSSLVYREFKHRSQKLAYA